MQLHSEMTQQEAVEYFEKVKNELVERLLEMSEDAVNKFRKFDGYSFFYRDIVTSFYKQFVIEGSDKVNKDAISTLASYIIENLQVITDKAMFEIAEESISDLQRGDTAWFYVSHSKPSELTPDGSARNSDHHMLQIVRKIAQQKGIDIRLVQIEDGKVINESEIKEIRIIDDVGYSGIQKSSELTTLLEKLSSKPSLRYFFAGLTESAKNRIRTTAKTLGINASIKYISSIPVLSDHFEVFPPLKAYFRAVELSEMNTESLKNTTKVHDIIDSLSGRLTLTRTQYKIPDNFSLMPEVSESLKSVLTPTSYRTPN